MSFLTYLANEGARDSAAAVESINGGRRGRHFALPASNTVRNIYSDTVGRRANKKFHSSEIVITSDRHGICLLRLSLLGRRKMASFSRFRS